MSERGQGGKHGLTMEHKAHEIAAVISDFFE